jgi:pyridoxine/pyridoxamine 5'-phosphate oxidase
MTGPDAALARAIMDRVLYMVLATADRDGQPWASPVYFATADHAEFLWVSSPAATHSLNIAVRPRIGIVIFDSQAPIGTGQGVYILAHATELPDADLERAIQIFSRRSRQHGGLAWNPEDVRGEALLRLYSATALSYSMLAKDGQPDHRVKIEIGA